MAKKKWWQYLLVFLRLVAREAEDGSIGAGKKTAKAGRTAGQVLDEVTPSEPNP